MQKIMKKAGFLAAALAGVVMLAAPSQANARVRIGVSIGAPVYVAPVAPYSYSYPYSDQYYSAPYSNYDYTYADPYPAYRYVASTYVAPSFSFGWGGHNRHERFEHERHKRHERFEHGRDFRGYRR